MKNHKIKITLPHSIDYLPVSLNAVSIIAKLSGFDKEEILKIETATEEVVSNVIRVAYNNNESTFDVIAEMQAMGLLIIIKEENTPFIPGLEHEYDPKAIQPKPEYKGLNNILVKKLMDKVWYHSLGEEGLETHLFKYLKEYNLHIKSTTESEKPEQEQGQETL